MFSGIVHHQGRIGDIKRGPSSLRLQIQSQFRSFQLGESISVDGVCLTVADFGQDWFSCDLSAETLQKTKVNDYKVESPVNLERALRMGDPVGGHWVTGHVDQTVAVRTTEKVDSCLKASFDSTDPTTRKYLVPKGSVAIDGVSLTINEVTRAGFDVMLIPHTLEKTTLGTLRENQVVNIDFDWMTKIICNAVETRMSQLKEV